MDMCASHPEPWLAYQVVLARREQFDGALAIFGEGHRMRTVLEICLEEKPVIRRVFRNENTQSPRLVVELLGGFAWNPIFVWSSAERGTEAERAAHAHLTPGRQLTAH